MPILIESPAAAGGGGGNFPPPQWTVDAHGGLTIEPGDAGTVPLILIGTDDQDNALFILKHHSSGDLATYGPGGVFDTAQDMIVDPARGSFAQFAIIEDAIPGSPRMGLATLGAGGTVTVTTAAVTAVSRIFLTPQDASGTIGSVRISAVVAGTSFDISSTNVLDRSDVAWLIIEP